MLPQKERHPANYAGRKHQPETPPTLRGGYGVGRRVPDARSEPVVRVTTCPAQTLQHRRPSNTRNIITGGADA
jgi:hypothetical protein